MTRKDGTDRGPGAGDRWTGHVRHFGLTQEQTHVVPAVWRRRKERQRQLDRATAEPSTRQD